MPGAVPTTDAGAGAGPGANGVSPTASGKAPSMKAGGGSTGLHHHEDAATRVESLTPAREQEAQ
jgi:hypothetical protein